MSEGRKPPDKAEEKSNGAESDSESDTAGMARTKSKAPKGDTKVKQAVKRKKESSISIDSSVESDSGNIADIDHQKHTKSELKSLVSSLLKTTAAQNSKISELGAKIEQMNDIISDLRGKLEKTNEIHENPSDTNKNAQNGDASNGATICDDTNDDDDMDTHVLDDLLTVPNNENTNFDTEIDNNTMKAFFHRNKQLLSTNGHMNAGSSNSVGLGDNNNNKGKSTISSSEEEKGTPSNGNKKGQQIIISKPQTANKENNNNSKFKVNKKKSPEIVVYNMVNKKETLVHLKALLGHDRVLFRFINKDKTAILTENNTDRMKVLDFLNGNSSRYFTFTPSDEKPLNFLIKYIDESFDEDDIKQDILLLNKDIGVLKLKVFSTTKPLIGKKIWLLQTENNEKAKSIVGNQKLCSAIVKIDIYKSNAVLQCKRCQRFDHAASNCHNPYRCVKCGKEEEEINGDNVVVGHKPGECPLDQTKVNGNLNKDELFCCNCKHTGHPANYTKCPKFAEQIEKRNNRTVKAAEKKEMYNNFVSTGLSFVDQVKSNQNKNNKNTKAGQHLSASRNSNNTDRTSNLSNNSYMQNECKNILGEDMLSILSKINRFIPEYKKLANNQKSVKLIEFLFNLSSQNEQ